MSDAGAVQYSPYLLPDEPPPRPRRRRGFAVLAGVVAVALGVGALAVQAGGGSGAGSPEDAVRRLLEAAGQSDALGVLEALPPSERDALTDPLLDIESELTRLGLLGEGFDPAAIGGVRADVDPGLVLSTEELSADVVAVHVEGSVALTFEGAGFPFGGRAEDVFGDDLRSSDSVDLSEAADDDLVVVAVREDGDWHASVWYSFAEAWRRDAGEELPPFGAGVPAVGADEPEAAVEAFLQASVDLEYQRMVELLAPDEARVLHDYAPLFLDEARESQEEVDIELETVLEDVRLSAEGEGDRRRVTLDHALFRTTYDGHESIVEIDGQCFRRTSTEDGPEGFDSCDPPDGADEVRLVPHQSASLPTTYEVVQRDGSWFLAPVRTMLGGVRERLEVRAPDELEDDEFAYSVLSVLNPLLFASYGAVGYSTSVESEVVYEGPEGECYAASDADLTGEFDEATFEASREQERACIERLVAEGALDESHLDSYLADDCRSGSPAERSEERLRASLAEERSCLQGLVDSGRLTESFWLEDVITRECGVPVVVAGEGALGAAFAAAQGCLEEQVAAGELDEYVLEDGYALQNGCYQRDDPDACLEAGVAAGVVDESFLEDEGWMNSGGEIITEYPEVEEVGRPTTTAGPED